MTDIVIPRGEMFFGRVCSKHEELKGQRYLSNHSCVGCSRARAIGGRTADQEKLKTMARLLEIGTQLVGANPEPCALSAQFLEESAAVLNTPKKEKCKGCGYLYLPHAHFCRGCGVML